MTDWDRLFEEHGPFVFRIAWRLLCHAADVEDVVQETFLEAYRLQTRQPVKNWRGLLRRMATLTALRRLRQRRPTVPLAEATVLAKEELPEQSAARRETETQLRLALSQLPEREAAVFCLRYFDDLSLHEIGAQLGIGYSAAGVALYRARQKLERALAGGQGGPTTCRKIMN